MKQAILAFAAAAIALCTIAPAFAYDHYSVCHKIRVHHHWETRCHH